MVTLSKIRDLVLTQEKELENLMLEYFSQIGMKPNNVNEFNQSENLEDKKQKIKSEIESLIGQGNLDNARQLLEEYKSIAKNDISSYSIEGVINLNENNLEGALDNFIKGLELDNTNADILYNMAYLNLIVGNNEEAIYYYEECLKYTRDEELANEVYNTLDSIKVQSKSYTLITYGISKEEVQILSGEHNVINLIERDDINYENKYEENGITVCEVNPNQTLDMIDYLVRRNENSMIVFTDIYKLDSLSNFKESAKLVYYPTKNYYTDKTNYLNHSVDMFKEKNVSDVVDLIITDDINTYNSKKIIERRDNVYLLNSNINELFTIDNIINNIDRIDEEYMNNSLKEYIKGLDDEYEKSLYLIASENNNIQNCVELARYINEKYNTEEMYQLCVSLLSETNDYNTLAATVINSEYCDDIFKAEVTYLNAIGNYDLIKFIVDTSIKNYKMVEKTSNDELEYKMALYNFELNNFDTALNKYIDLLNTDSNTTNSPLVNRNTGYLLYASGNENYEQYYDSYKDMMESFFLTEE